MRYILGEIHGNYRLYKQMLALIDFSEHDELYPIGDMIDRGDGGVDVLSDMSLRTNVFPILGNHEYLAAKVLTGRSSAPHETLKKWYSLGGAVTHRAFISLDPDTLEGLTEYLTELPLFEELQVNGAEYVLTHSEKTKLPDELSGHIRIFGDPADNVGNIGSSCCRSRSDGGLELITGQGLCAFCLDTHREFYVF